MNFSPEREARRLRTFRPLYLTNCAPPFRHNDCLKSPSYPPTVISRGPAVCNCFQESLLCFYLKGSPAVCKDGISIEQSAWLCTKVKSEPQQLQRREDGLMGNCMSGGSFGLFSETEPFTEHPECRSVALTSSTGVLP